MATYTYLRRRYVNLILDIKVEELHSGNHNTCIVSVYEEIIIFVCSARSTLNMLHIQGEPLSLEMHGAR